MWISHAIVLLPSDFTGEEADMGLVLEAESKVGRHAVHRCGTWKEGSYTSLSSYVIVHKAKYKANKSTYLIELLKVVKKKIIHKNTVCSGL